MAARRAGHKFGAAHLRLALLGLGLVGAWLAMGVRLYQVQVIQAPTLAAEGVGQRRTEQVLLPQRGNIFDRNGDPIAMTVEAESIYVQPQELTEPLFVAQQVGGMLGVDSNELLASINPVPDSFTCGDRSNWIWPRGHLARSLGGARP